MALKKKITKSDYDKLSDERKKDYKAGEFSDTYVLDVDGEDESDDPAELRRALAREREDKKKAQRELRELKATGGETAEGEEGEEGEPETPARRGRPSRAEADAKKIDADWLKKYNKDIGAKDAKIAALTGAIKKTMLDGTANAMAARISTSPKLMAKAILDRLSVDMDGDEPELVILGDDGKPSGLSLEKLEKEFLANKEFASIMIASKASGGGAPKTGAETKQPGGGAPASDTKPTDLSKMAPKDLAAHLKAAKEAKANA